MAETKASASYRPCTILRVGRSDLASNRAFTPGFGIRVTSGSSEGSVFRSLVRAGALHSLADVGRAVMITGLVAVAVGF
ncbi:MAG: hypothetical protein WBD41_28255, partial [Rhodococcus sp. (in: high G+C Gram-positive bacteria)]